MKIDPSPWCLQEVDDRGDVERDGVRVRLHHFRPEVEVVVAAADAGRASEVVEGDGVDALLGEAEREVFVEGMQPRTSGRMTIAAFGSPSGFALNAANSLPSDAFSVIDSPVAAPPAIGGTGGLAVVS